MKDGAGVGEAAAARDDAGKRLVAALAAGRLVSRDELRAFLAAAAEADDDARDEDGRAALRATLGRAERFLVSACLFAEADAFCRVRLDLERRECRRRFQTRRDVSSLFRVGTYGLWRFTSLYGTSPLRLGWVIFNIAFWFSVLYFVLDVVALRWEGRHAFATAAAISYGSYFVIGLEGLFPGTAALLANTYPAQVALAVENIIGVVLGLSLVSLTARRAWRGWG